MKPSPFRHLRAASDTLDRAFQLYRRHFLAFIMLPLLLFAPMLAVYQLLASFYQIQLIQAWLLYLGAQAVLVGPCIAVAAASLQVSQTRWRFSQLPGNVGKSAGASLTQWACLVLPCVFAVVLGMMLQAIPGDTIAYLLIAPLTLLLILFLWAHLYILPATLILTEHNFISAVRYSWRISHHRYEQTYWLMVFVPFWTYVLAQAPAIATYFLGLWLGFPETTIVLLRNLLSYAGIVVALPLQASAITVLYHELQNAFEGRDLQVRIENQEPRTVTG